MIFGFRKLHASKGKSEVIEYRHFKHFNVINFRFELELPSNLSLDYIDPNNSRGKRVPWLTRELIDNKRQKEYLMRKATLFKSKDDWSVYKSLENSYYRIIKSTDRQYYQEELQSTPGDLKKTWKTIIELMNKSMQIMQ